MAENLSVPQVPREIIKYIIEKTDDLKTLKNWALVDWGANAVAESILWQNVNADDIFEVPEGLTDPLWTLRKEELQRGEPDYFLDPENTPLCHRNSLVKHIWLRANPDEYLETEISDRATLNLFRTSSAAFPNLKSIRIDGVVSQLVWDTLLELPSLRELRLWRVGKSTDLLSNFQRLSRLRALEIGKLLPEEALALGDAVRESTLETLHVSSAEAELRDADESMVAFFFAGLTRSSIGSKDRFEEAEGANCGFPGSLKQLAIDGVGDIGTGPLYQVIKAFRNCRDLAHLYLDLSDVGWFAGLLQHLYLPALTHLYMPLVKDASVLDRCHGEAETGLVATFLERHQDTLIEFRLLNAANDRGMVKQLWCRVKAWLSIEEIRMDSTEIDDSIRPIRKGLEWARAAVYLGTDGTACWGHDLCRARLDRFDLFKINEAFLSSCTWQNLKVLVLNPRLRWTTGLFPEPNDYLNPRIRDSEWRHIQGSARPINQQECAEKLMAERIVRRMKSDHIRVISIEGFRFWVEPLNQVVWYLSDALTDEVQSLQVMRQLDQKDWEFLSERVNTTTGRGHGTAVFSRNQQLPSVSGDIPTFTTDAELRDLFLVRIDRVLGRSVAEFSQLPASERTRTLRRLLVASTPISIWDKGVSGDHNDSIEEHADLLLQERWTGDEQITLEAQEVYYGDNSFRLPLWCLGDFWDGYEPSHTKKFVRRLTISICTSEKLYDLADLEELLNCKQIHQVTLEITGQTRCDVNSVIRAGRHIIGQLQRRLGNGFQILKGLE